MLAPTRPPDVDRAGSIPANDRVALVLATAGPAGVAAAVAVSHHLEVTPTLHDVSLFVHLAALLVGFGAVLAVDWLGVLWLLGRIPLRSVLVTASRLTVPIWLGLAGLLTSGAFLSPDPTSPRTIVKLVLVAALGVNGAYVHHLHPVLAAAGDPPPPRLLLRGACSTTISQLCWWGATVIGFLNARS